MKDAFVMTMASSVMFYAILILFGAPITTHFTQTYLLGLLLSLLAVYPIAYTLGKLSFDASSNSLIRRMLWIRLFAELSYVLS